jgi:hypothetical protein
MLRHNCKFASETEAKSENTVAFEKKWLGLEVKLRFVAY